MDIQFSYSVGQQIEARDPSSCTWRPATVMKLAPYRGKPGYYISWTDIQAPTEKWQPLPSSGGWAYEACMRPVQ